MAIVETILGAVLQLVFDRLTSPEVIKFFRHSKFDQSLVDRLKTLMLAAEKLLLDAEDKQLTDPMVKQWLDQLKHWFYRAEEVVDEIATEALRSSLNSPPEPQSFKTKIRNFIPGLSSTSSIVNNITVKVKEVTNMLESMLGQKDALGLRELSVAAKAPPSQRVPTTSLMEDSTVCGRDQEREKIIEFLVSNENGRNGIGVIAIVGMGGLGKTTLAKLVYNDSRLDEFFDLKMWVCVSDQFDVHRVTKSVLESILGQPYSGFPDLNFLQVELSGKLREKRFLLALDDVWSEDYQSWECLRAPFSVGANGSKIIVTTRNGEVASMMRTAPMFHLKPLTEEDGWSLFLRHVFESESLVSNPILHNIGKQIVQKCRGLPLAIKTLGGLLRYKQEIGEWEAILHSKLWDLPCDKSHVIPALRLSYYYLPSHLKRCFSYCALFPKDYTIDRKQLVLLWMAENYVLQTERRIEDVADEYVNHLLSRSLLEPMGASLVTIHDLVHDLAELVSGELLARHELKNPSKFSEKARHFSYLAGHYNGITKFQAVDEAKYLRTFISLPDSQLLDTDEYYMSKRVSIELIPQLYYLRVLSMSKYKNLLLPESIGNLKQLHYLDFSHNKIKRLPESVSTLYNLQTLILSECNCLESLPVDLGSLALLRHLDLTRTTSLLYMPRKMGNLMNLQTLTDFVVGKGSGSTIQELSKLLDIRGKLALRRLQNITAPEDAFDAILGDRKFLQELALEFDVEDNDDCVRARKILEYLKPHDNLERLTIRNYVGTRFPIWLAVGCQVYLRNITSLCLSGCCYSDSLPSLGQFPSLKKLEILGMEYIRSVGPEFYGHSSALSNPFPALVSLTFKNMKKWKVWSDIDVEGNVVWFSYLEKLYLVDCPKLAGHLPTHMPLLGILMIDKCEQLKGFLPRVPSIHPMEVAASPRANLITKLVLVRLEQLVQLPSEICRLSSLKNLYILSCKNLTSLSNARLPAILHLLHIHRCENLEFLPEGMVYLTHLQKIKLEQCPYLRWVQGNNLPTSLHSLEVESCQRLEFPIPFERMHQYTSLEILSLINTGRHLVSFPLGIIPNLCHLVLWKCKDLQKVYIPDQEEMGGDNLMALSRLLISNCPKLKMVGKATGRRAEATVIPAPNLERLDIICCENLKPILLQTGEEVFLPKLQRLIIENMDKMLSLRSSPRLSLLRFSHLIVLSISNHNGKCFPDERTVGSLPCFLKELVISGFPKLRYLDGKALQGLTFLEYLHIINCPLLQRLPEEGLPHLLGCLEISECPLLEESCRTKKGQDWSKISHLPCVIINGDCICIADP